MNSGKKQFALILILILALFIHMEGFTPELLASSEVPVALQDEVDGIEFKAIIDGKWFARTEGLVIQACFTNVGKVPMGYYAGSTSDRAAGADLYSKDKNVQFSDKLAMEKEGTTSDGAVKSGVLMPGESINMDISMIPFYKKNGEVKLAKPGEYILRLWYCKEGSNIIKAEFPVTVSKRFGRMYIKG